MEPCRLCPRMCGADREKEMGYCGGGANVKIARAALHMWEEPCISGTNGSGAVFFSGCPLQCCFCQNYKISAENFGKEISVERLSEIFLELQEKNAHNINLVNPTHYVPWIIQALDRVKPRLHIPVVYNSGGYERVETLRMLEGYVDIYLPDIKYKDSGLSKKYLSAPDYFDVAQKAVMEMYHQTGKVMTGADHLLKKGLLIRHLVMPQGVKDSISIFQWLKENLPVDNILVSVMNQYTPCYKSRDFEDIDRKITKDEYEKVLDAVSELGFYGYAQEEGSAKEEYIPDFDLEGV